MIVVGNASRGRRRRCRRFRVAEAAAAAFGSTGTALLTVIMMTTTMVLAGLFSVCCAAFAPVATRQAFSSSSSSAGTGRIARENCRIRGARDVLGGFRLLSSSTSSSSSSSSTGAGGGSDAAAPASAAATTGGGGEPPSAQNPVEPEEELVVVDPDRATDEWELDCYSRPVVVNGKKLWEVLITDSNGSFRYRKELPGNQVNSRTLRQVVDDLVEESDVKPNTIRFFRGAMFNMINIALGELPVTGKPSRCTFELASWLEDRHVNVYPKMEGYNKGMAGGSLAGGGPSFLDVRTPVKMPDALRGEKYAFVALPVAEFLPGGGVTPDNVGVGRLCTLPADLPADAFVQGIVVMSRRAKALASWLSGTELVSVNCDLRKRILTMECDIDTQYLMAKLDDVQRAEGAAFEEGKDALRGLHFVCVQESDDDDQPAGFWLLRDLPAGI